MFRILILNQSMTSVNYKQVCRIMAKAEESTNGMRVRTLESGISSKPIDLFTLSSHSMSTQTFGLLSKFNKNVNLVLLRTATSD